MAEVESSRYSRHLLMYHMVWIPKYRRVVLRGEVADHLKVVLAETAAGEVKAWMQSAGRRIKRHDGCGTRTTRLAVRS